MDSLWLCQCMAGWGRASNLHRVPREEGLEIPLGGGIGKISNVETTTFGGAGNDRFVIGSIDRGVTTSHIVGTSRGNRSDGGIGEGVSNVVN